MLLAVSGCSTVDDTARPTISPGSSPGAQTTAAATTVTDTTVTDTTTVTSPADDATATPPATTPATAPATTPTATPGTTASEATTAPAGGSPQDVAAWLVTSHQLNLARLQAGRSAQASAVTADVRELGSRWADDYTALDTELRARADARGVTLPDSPTPQSETDLAAVERQPGDAFDAAWTARETGDITAYLAHVDDPGPEPDPDVAALAALTRPVLEEHLDLLAAAGRPVEAVPAGQGPAGGLPRSAALAVAAAGAVLVLAAGLGAARVRRRS
ncbi:MAG: DUF4142 domain-containing protein [Kineosporiaceae bacterium]